MALEDQYELTGLLTEDCQYVQFTHWKMFQKTLKKWVGKDLRITVQVLRYKRSDAQNKFMWAIIVPYVRKWLHDTQGVVYSREEVYTWLRVKLLAEQPKVVEIAGEEVVTMTGKKFSAMNTKEFSIAVDTIREEMLKKGCDIPEPKKGKRHHLVEEYLTDD